jgi:hypothetical protein
MSTSARLSLFVTSSALALICASCSSPTDGPFGSSASPIEGGELINNGMDDVAKKFPLSTVTVRVQRADNTVDRCTGVVVGTRKVLTAAHCFKPKDPFAWVLFYPVTGSGNTPDNATENNMVSVDTQDGAACSGDLPGLDDPGCRNKSGDYADIAIMTLANDIPSDHKPVSLAPSMWYQMWLQLHHNEAHSFWTVGTGEMSTFRKGCALPDGTPKPPEIKNESSIMEWVPTFTLSSNGNGRITTAIIFADWGDSGGPLFTYADDKSGSLMLVGITSRASYDCYGRLPSATLYTDVTQKGNYDWITAGVSPPPPPPPKPASSTSTFGAAL